MIPFQSTTVRRQYSTLEIKINTIREEATHTANNVTTFRTNNKQIFGISQQQQQISTKSSKQNQNRSNPTSCQSHQQQKKKMQSFQVNHSPPMQKPTKTQSLPSNHGLNPEKLSLRKVNPSPSMGKSLNVSMVIPFTNSRSSSVTPNRSSSPGSGSAAAPSAALAAADTARDLIWPARSGRWAARSRERLAVSETKPVERRRRSWERRAASTVNSWDRRAASSARPRARPHRSMAAGDVGWAST